LFVRQLLFRPVAREFGRQDARDNEPNLEGNITRFSSPMHIDMPVAELIGLFSKASAYH
jgi:hypothetical protein